MTDNQPKPKWYASLNQQRKDWRMKNPKAHDITFAAIGLVIAATLAFWIGVARGAPPPTLDCPAPAAWSLNTTTNVVTCAGVPTTPPPGGGVDPPPVTGGDACVSGDGKSANVWGNPTVYSWDVAPFVHQTIAFKIQVPSDATGTSLRTSGWAEYTTGKFQRDGAFSNVACSFLPADALSNGFGSKIITKGNVAPSFIYRIGTPSGGAAGLTPGKTYWINLRNRNSDGSNSCTLADCAMRGNVPP